ncbi:flagellar hook-associated protein FlgK [Solicola sp. PLA-1-18]|uniref:flagellar hook-associated protein FlgK n=1 Tax=Solicola sp. PLA-1-18 TaxID=3380532 RepID=UPI003B767C13
MAGSFASLSTALSALRHHQVAMDVASGNVANAGTEGYSRRRVVAEAAGAPAVPALWSRSIAGGAGVTTAAVDRIVDPFLDARGRVEHAHAQQLSTTASSLGRLEASLAEPGVNGLSTALGALSGAWAKLADAPNDTAARAQVLEAARTVTSTLGAQARAVGSEWTAQRESATQLVGQVNDLATELAAVNRSIQASTDGTDAATLLDQRDQLTMRLSELTGAGVLHEADGTATVRLGAATLVGGSTARTLTVSGATTITGQATDPVSFAVDGTAATVPSGSLGATASLLGTGIPGHLAALDQVVAGIASAVNTAHQGGKDLDGAPGGAFFTGTTAATLSVAITDPRQVAAAGSTQGAFGSGNADVLAGLDVSTAYRAFVGTVGAQVASADRASATQSGLAAQVDASREAVSGVNTDEEMVNLLTSQRAYEAAARVMSTLDSVLDTLINRTGAR